MFFEKRFLHLLFYYFWKMETLIMIGIGVLLLLGLIGSVIPVLPGPSLSYLGLLLSHFFISKIQVDFVFWLAVLVFFVTVLDYYLQIYGVKKAGGGKYAIRGSIVGMLLGIFLFPPFGILLGAFIGAYIGALSGFIAGTILKLCTSLYVIYILLF